MAAHRYWRIYCLKSGSVTYVVIGDVQFRTTAGVALAFTGGTPSASSVFSTNAAALACDGNLATEWKSYGTPPQWWRYDYGAGSGFDIVEVALSAPTSGDEALMPTVFTIQFSDDGATWVTACGYVTAVWAASESRVFAVNPAQPVDSVSHNTTWDPARTDTGLTLSNGNLTATKDATANISSRSTSSHSTGKRYFEVRLINTNNSSSGGVVDLNNENFYAVMYLIGSPSSFSQGGNGTGAWSSSWGRFGINFDDMTWQFRSNDTNAWVVNDLSAIKGRSLAIIAKLAGGVSGDSFILNTGKTAFAGAMPAGFSAWDSSGAVADAALTAAPAVLSSAAKAAVAAALTRTTPAVAVVSHGEHVIGTTLRLTADPATIKATGVLGGTPQTMGLGPAVAVISQYSTSPTILTLVAAIGAWLDPSANLNAFYHLIWNVETAQGLGLDIWGRIVGVQRVLAVPSGMYFGMAEANDPSAESPFNSGGPVYSGAPRTGNYALTDDAFRLLIFAKAALNISDGSIPAINQVLLLLFPGRGNCYVTDGQDMTMTYTFEFPLQLFESSIVEASGVLPKPVGVHATVIQVP